MPWKEVSAMSLRLEFALLAAMEDFSIRELCRRFSVSPRTGYKWLSRYRVEGMTGLADRSRKPRKSPTRTSEDIEEMVVDMRLKHPVWGGRTIQARLQAQGYSIVPRPSTITAILHRRGLIGDRDSSGHRAWHRFEHEAPNQLWQMDFKGHFSTTCGRCHPLTVLDDHSRFALGLEACRDELGTTVKERLTLIFRRYGLPQRMIMDHGSPWGSDPEHPYTSFTVWLMRLGIAVCHGRPYHPQTQGKNERFHRTLKAEVLQGNVFNDLRQCQHAFDKWRDVYNFERPHQALGYATPASRYRPSSHSFHEMLPAIEYGPDDLVRKVQAGGEITFHGRSFKVSKAFYGLPIALRPTKEDGLWQAYFLTQPIAYIDLRSPNGV
jgi:transposase InsO family protein